MRPVTGRIGAEISGVDLTGGLDDDTVAAIRTGLLEHRVVFFRDQDRDSDGLVAFAERFGPVTNGHPTIPGPKHNPVVQAIQYPPGRLRANSWHSDVSFVEHPPLGSILRAIVVPPHGGDTVWANTVAGYEDLPPELRTAADTLWSLHTNDFDYQVANASAEVDPDSLQDFQKRFASTVFKTLHPVVQVHPETGSGRSSSVRSRSRSMVSRRPTRSGYSRASRSRSPSPSTRCAGVGRRGTSRSGTTGPRSTTAWPTSVTSRGSTSASPSRAACRWRSTGAPARCSSATTPRSPGRPDVAHVRHKRTLATLALAVAVVVMTAAAVSAAPSVRTSAHDSVRGSVSAAKQQTDLSGVTLKAGDQLQILRTQLAASGEDKNVPYDIEWSTFVGGPAVLAAQTGGSVDVGFMAETPSGGLHRRPATR